MTAGSIRYMTDGEIRVMYRQAKNPDKQIRILAELNAVSVDKILNIIMEDENMANKINWTPVLDADVDRLRAEGWTFDKIGERIGCSGKAAGIRYYKRHKPVHTPAASEPAQTIPGEPKSTFNEYDKLLARPAVGVERTQDALHTVLFNIHGDLTQQADHIATITGLLHLVRDAASNATHYHALMARIDILLELLTESTETLDQVAERLDTAIKNQPQSGNSTAD